jgi:hypothetical protein
MNRITTAACKSNDSDYSFEKSSISKYEKSVLPFGVHYRAMATETLKSISRKSFYPSSQLPLSPFLFDFVSWLC